MNVAALMPVKGFRNAKQRLSRILGSAARELLAETMFRDVLRQARIARGLAGTFVVTGDDQVAAIASALGTEVIREAEERGETSAVDFARQKLQSAGCEAVLIIPADMPLVRAADIEQVLARVPEGATVPFALLVPSHDRLGTNALLLAPQGLPFRYMENEHMALDIDEPKDLEQFLSYGLNDGESTRVARTLLAEQNAQAIRRLPGV